MIYLMKNDLYKNVIQMMNKKTTKSIHKEIKELRENLSKSRETNLKRWAVMWDARAALIQQNIYEAYEILNSVLSKEEKE